MAANDLSELQRAIGRVEGKMDTFIAQMQAHDDRTTGLEVRTRNVENKQYWLSGLGSAVGYLVGILSTHNFK